MVRLLIRSVIASFALLLSNVALSQDTDSIDSNRHDAFLSGVAQKPADTVRKSLAIVFAGNITAWR